MADVEQKLAALEGLYTDWKDCERCGLCNPVGRARGKVAFGSGDVNAHLMIIGDTPSPEDELHGEPFTGRLGEILDMFLSAHNSSRDEVFITNLTGCRATDDADYRKRRDPSAAELSACSPRLTQLIEIVDPYVVLLLGSKAYSTLSPNTETFSKVASHRHTPDIGIETKGLFFPVSRPAIATWHPSDLLQRWDKAAGQSLAAWGKAFHLADTYAELYQGITPPLRSQDDK